MDEINRNRFKEVFNLVNFAVAEESIREKEHLVQFKLDRNGLTVIVSFFDNKPLCEILFPYPFIPSDVAKLSELIKDPDFSFELRKSLTAPNILFGLDIKDGEFKGVSVFAQIYKKADDIDLSELANSINNVVNHGLLCHFCITMHLNKHQGKGKNADNMFS